MAGKGKARKAKSPGSPGLDAKLLSRSDIEDAEIVRLARMADDGDQEAAPLLHEALARMLMKSELSDVARRILIEQHQSLAEGKCADAAMLTKNIGSRPPKTLRDERIFGVVSDLMALRDHLELNRPRIESKYGPQPRKQTNEEIYDRAGALLQLPGARVKTIFLKERRKALAK